MLVSLIAILFTSASVSLASCDVDSLRNAFLQSYEIPQSAAVLTRYSAQLTANDKEIFHSLSEKFRTLGDSESELNQKFMLQKIARIHLRKIAARFSFPVLNPLESPYDILYREDKIRSGISVRAHEIRIILAEPNAAPEAVQWQQVMRRQYNPFFVNRIVVRKDRVIVNFTRENYHNAWLDLDRFLALTKDEHCH